MTPAPRKVGTRADHRSDCPINLTVEVLGDRWTLLVIRDMIFSNRRHFRELLLHSDEGIASNVLADRLKTLVEQGILTKAEDPDHKQKAIYSLTEQGIGLVPLLAQMTGWALEYLVDDPESGGRARMLQEGGPKLWDAFMAELRGVHLGAPARGKSKSGPGPVTARLQAAHDAAIARLARQRRR